MKTLKMLLTLVVACGAQFAAADDILVRNAQVHTMGRDGMLDGADILISGNEVKRIGRNLSAPQGATIIDANGRPVTPALFAGISEIGLVEVSGVEQTVDDAYKATETPSMRPEFDVTPAFNPNSTVVPVTRIEGFGFTLLGAGEGGSIISGQGRVVALDGGYDSLFGNRVLFLTLGRGASELSGGSRAAQWMLLNQAMSEAREAPAANEPAVLTRAGRAVLKGYTEGGTVVFGVNRAADILQVIDFARRQGFKAVIAGGAEAWMVADRLAKAGVPVVLDALQDLPSNFDELGSRLDNAALLQAAGVTIAFSGDLGGFSGTHNARKNRQLAGNAVSYGLDHEAGIAALTINPARMFGVDRQFGSLEAGKRADLVVWSGDPLEVTTAADAVIINGRVDPMQSRQTRLRDRYLVEHPELPRAYVK